MIDLIVEKAAHNLFDTPTCSEIPTDSFEEDFEPEFFMNEEEIKKRELERINKELEEQAEWARKNKRRHHSPSRCNKRKERIKKRKEQMLKNKKRKMASMTMGRYSKSMRKSKKSSAEQIIEKSSSGCSTGSIKGSRTISVEKSDQQEAVNKPPELPISKPPRPSSIDSMKFDSISLLSRFQRCKNTVRKSNNRQTDWTDIFQMRQSSMKFTLREMRKEQQS